MRSDNTDCAIKLHQLFPDHPGPKTRRLRHLHRPPREPWRLHKVQHEPERHRGERSQGLCCLEHDEHAQDDQGDGGCRGGHHQVQDCQIMDEM